jgi:transcriptional regulator with XRE-family HTH domain
MNGSATTTGDSSRPGLLLGQARRRAGITQTDLAARLGITQAAVAQLERADANPRIATLDRALRATGAALVIGTRPRAASVDESLIRRHLSFPPSQRLHGLEVMYEEARELTRAGLASRGQLA